MHMVFFKTIKLYILTKKPKTTKLKDMYFFYIVGYNILKYEHYIRWWGISNSKFAENAPYATLVRVQLCNMQTWYTKHNERGICCCTFFPITGQRCNLESSASSLPSPSVVTVTVALNRWAFLLPWGDWIQRNRTIDGNRARESL